MSKTYGIVTARGGSKGMPGKNIRRVGGKPLIAWTIEAALKSSKVKRVILSTDDAEIARIGREWGAEVPFMRPAELAQDNVASIPVMLHALDWLEREGDLPDYLTMLQPTSPLRTSEDLDKAIGLAESRKANAVIGVSEMDWHPFVSRRIEADGTLTPFVDGDISRFVRQNLAPAYAINGAIYVNSAESLRRDQILFPTGTLAYVMPQERSIDIDTPTDLLIAEVLLKVREGVEEGLGSIL